MQIAQFTVAATQEFIWLKGDGTEVPVQAMVGVPYPDGDDWGCPAALHGVDGRYRDIFGISGLQAMCLAMKLIRTQLVHLLGQGETLLYVSEGRERVGVEDMATLFGLADPRFET